MLYDDYKYAILYKQAYGYCLWQLATQYLSETKSNDGNDSNEGTSGGNGGGSILDPITPTNPDITPTPMP